MTFRVSLGTSTFPLPSKPFFAQSSPLASKQWSIFQAKNGQHFKLLAQRTTATFAIYNTHRPFSSLNTPHFKERVTRPLEWDKKLQKHAEDLIFGPRPYSDFTFEEKEIVDFYQTKILEIDGGVILPNTRVDYEQQEISKILRQSKDSKHG